MAECERHPGNVLPGCWYCRNGAEPPGSPAVPGIPAALAAIDAANHARGAAWVSLQLAEMHLSYARPRPGIARQALADALEACEDMRKAITEAQAALPAPGEESRHGTQDH